MNQDLLNQLEQERNSLLFRANDIKERLKPLQVLTKELNNQLLKLNDDLYDIESFFE